MRQRPARWGLGKFQVVPGRSWNLGHKSLLTGLIKTAMPMSILWLSPIPPSLW